MVSLYVAIFHTDVQHFNTVLHHSDQSLCAVLKSDTVVFATLKSLICISSAWTRYSLVKLQAFAKPFKYSKILLVALICSVVILVSS